MILRRLGNKKKIAKKIQAYFPPHKIYIEPFFGAGGMFFRKPKVEHNIVNDLDSDVFNLFQVVTRRKEELIQQVKDTPIHMDLLKYWKSNTEEDDILKAMRFLFLSNFTYLGKMDTLRLGAVKEKQSILKHIDLTNEILEDVRFSNLDFRKFLKSISLHDKQKDKTFCYADPPYLNTVNTYKDSDTWTEKDCSDLFDSLDLFGAKFAYSEFNHPFILQQAKERGLNIIEIGERRNLKNRRTEILVTNYKTNQLKLF